MEKLVFGIDYANGTDHTAMVWIRGTNPMVVEKLIILTKEETKAMLDALQPANSAAGRILK